MRVLAILFIAFLHRGSVAEVQLPPGVPKIRWSPNLLYTEEGFRLGSIVRFGEHWFWHFEGELMLGFNSTPGIIMDHDCVETETAATEKIKNEKKKRHALNAVNSKCLIGPNPWPFSVVDRKLFDKYSDASASPVVLYYTQAVNGPAGLVLLPSAKALFTSTDNYVTEIWPVDPNFPTSSSYTEGSGELPPADETSYTSGTFQGHVVKASIDHLLFKTYEIVVQESKGGASFVRLSVDDSKLFDHIVMMMLTGKEIKMRFDQLFSFEGDFLSSIRGYSTNYRVTSVQISDEQPPMKENF